MRGGGGELGEEVVDPLGAQWLVGQAWQREPIICCVCVCVCELCQESVIIPVEGGDGWVDAAILSFIFSSLFFLALLLLLLSNSAIQTHHSVYTHTRGQSSDPAHLGRRREWGRRQLEVEGQAHREQTDKLLEDGSGTCTYCEPPGTRI